MRVLILKDRPLRRVLAISFLLAITYPPSAYSQRALNPELHCEPDSDNDGILDYADPCPHNSDWSCQDNCPDDPEKIEPDICGCNVADTDSDGDGTAGCIDPCPNDNPDDPDGDGVCSSDDNCPWGDVDGDSSCDDVDGCGEDFEKTDPGQCGCNTADTDSDGDGVADCIDPCPNDNPDDPDGDGVCSSDDNCPWGDVDGDSSCDDVDGCGEDFEKTDPGQCGCNTADTDSDGDGVADCIDPCPNDNPDDPDGDGVCSSDDNCPWGDVDGDGSCDDVDGCGEDFEKTDPGQCGCNAADTDSDGDGIADCIDPCPNDNPDDPDGDSVCSSDDNCPWGDVDGDGSCDDVDGCGEDFEKTDPGQCGCNTADTDSDGDGIADCIDGCGDDPAKTEPGQCGCGVDDRDSDGDGRPDCADGCPYFDQKFEPGICGCEISDTDSDYDGILDCIDGCPDDPEKKEPGACGCGHTDDGNHNEILDCEECSEGEVSGSFKELVAESIERLGSNDFAVRDLALATLLQLANTELTNPEFAWLKTAIGEAMSSTDAERLRRARQLWEKLQLNPIMTRVAAVQYHIAREIKEEGAWSIPICKDMALEMPLDPLPEDSTPEEIAGRLEASNRLVETVFQEKLRTLLARLEDGLGTPITSDLKQEPHSRNVVLTIALENSSKLEIFLSVSIPQYPESWLSASCNAELVRHEISTPPASARAILENAPIELLKDYGVSGRGLLRNLIGEAFQCDWPSIRFPRAERVRSSEGRELPLRVVARLIPTYRSMIRKYINPVLDQYVPLQEPFASSPNFDCENIQWIAPIASLLTKLPPLVAGPVSQKCFQNYLILSQGTDAFNTQFEFEGEWGDR